MTSELITIATYSTRFDAEFAKNILVAHGVRAMVSADDVGGMRVMPFAYTSGAELIVRQEDVDRAKALLLIQKNDTDLGYEKTLPLV
jgi:hypothetical protein